MDRRDFMQLFAGVVTATALQPFEMVHHTRVRTVCLSAWHVFDSDFALCEVDFMGPDGAYGILKYMTADGEQKPLLSFGVPRSNVTTHYGLLETGVRMVPAGAAMVLESNFPDVYALVKLVSFEERGPLRVIDDFIKALQHKSLHIGFKTEEGP